MIFGIALAIGLLAAWGARRYLAGQMEAIEARSRGQQVTIVVAKRELKAGDRLSSENVAVRPIPVEYAHSGAISPNEFERVEGRLIAFAAKPGEMLLWSMLEGKKSPTFSARVETGRRALTVPVDEINSISGMLEPGDLIDLIVSLDRHGKKALVPLLQNVRVMATGQRSVDDPKSGERRQYSTVTLDATPEQAQNVILARDVGKLTALLRNPQDARVAVKDADIAKLLGTPEGAETGSRAIPVLYGGGARLPEDALWLDRHRSGTKPAADADTPAASRPPTAKPVAAASSPSP